jgi:hypothetical protein
MFDFRETHRQFFVAFVGDAAVLEQNTEARRDFA